MDPTSLSFRLLTVVRQRTHEEADIGPHPVVGLVLRVRDLCGEVSPAVRS